jgi:hypothetical protein
MPSCWQQPFLEASIAKLENRSPTQHQLGPIAQKSHHSLPQPQHLLSNKGILSHDALLIMAQAKSAIAYTK